MGKPRILQIHFDNNFSTYFGGQYVTGRIYIENDDDITNIGGKHICSPPLNFLLYQKSNGIKN